MYHGHFLIILFKTEMTETKEQFHRHCLDECRNIVGESVEGGVISWKVTTF